MELYSEEERRMDYEMCCNDLYYLGKEILGYVDAEDVPHRELCEFIERPYSRKLLVGCRGIYKTCFGTVGRAIQLILRDPNVRILIVQNNSENASKTVTEIKSHFEKNEKLRRIRPDIIPENFNKTIWSSKSLVFNRKGSYDREPTVMAAGVRTSLTSLHFDYILGDDVVSAGRDEMKEGGMIILRPEDVEKAIGWYKITMRGLAINKKDYQTQVQFIVNRWGVEDFANYIIQNHLKSDDNPLGFEYLCMAAHRHDGELLWPTVMTDEYLQQAYVDLGDFMYNTQMECRPFNPDERGFQPENNVYWEGKTPPNAGKINYRIYALIDIADVTKAASCFTSMVVLWVDDMNHIWVGEAIRRKLDTVGKIRLIHDMVRKYELREVYIEENLHKDLLRHVLKEEMKKADLHYYVRPLKHKNRNKDARILRLQPHHERGALHIKRSHTSLIQELRDFPYTHWKDTVDALGYIMDFIKSPPKFIYQDTRIDYTPPPVTVKDIIEEEREKVWGGGEGIFDKQKPKNPREWMEANLTRTG